MPIDGGSAATVAVGALAVSSMTVASAAFATDSAAPVVWGDYGHELAAEVAVARLPDDMPTFFRGAGDQLVYLNPEPDRWREGSSREMNEAFRYDHYIDLENVPEAAFSARDRWRFVEALYEAGIEDPQVNVGFLPLHIVELFQRVRNGFVRWRAEDDPARRAWIEERIVNDAGLLGHFVTDAANPHHSTIHFNGWNEGAAPNPGGVTTDRGFHSRFESEFVSAHLRLVDISSRVPVEVTEIIDVRAAAWELVRDSNSAVLRLYELDRDVGFRPGSPAHPEARAFVAERLALGAEYLRDVWWAAWVQSGTM